MKREILVALRMTLVTLALTGLVYPLAVTGVAQLLFPRQASGSFVTADGRAVGSSLIAQSFRRPGYFQPRPSAAGANGYDAAASSGSNLGSTSKALRDRVTADRDRLEKENPAVPGPVPVELVTTSGSGLDPDLSPEAARWQVPRVAAARGVPIATVEALLSARVEGRTFGFLGEPRVNVLLLNLDLDRRLGRPQAASGREQ
jgi:K+-transporting ATPase ATPase C chain